MKYVRTYVLVNATFDPDGRIMPVSFEWRDGHKYDIEKVLDVKSRAAQKAGGMGERYTVRINGKERYMFLESSMEPYSPYSRWFVEEAVPEA